MNIPNIMMISSDHRLQFGAELGEETNPLGWTDSRGNATLSQVDGRVRCTADNGSTFGCALGVSGLTVGKDLIMRFGHINKTWGGDVLIRASESSNLGGTNFFSTTVNPVEHTFVIPATVVYIGFIGTGHSTSDYFDVDISSVKSN